MGKHFFGTHADKNAAMDLADFYANQWGACYTPSKESSCDFKNGVWTCMARAHANQGSCGRNERSRFGKSERRYGGTIPVIIFDSDKSIQKPYTDSGLNDESYSDALPKDYEL